MNYAFANRIATDGLDYDNDLTGYENKFTYLTPVMNGLQLGVSYTPDVGVIVDQGTVNISRGLTGVN